MRNISEETFPKALLLPERRGIGTPRTIPLLPAKILALKKNVSSPQDPFATSHQLQPETAGTGDCLGEWTILSMSHHDCNVPDLPGAELRGSAQHSAVHGSEQEAADHHTVQSNHC